MCPVCVGYVSGRGACVSGMSGGDIGGGGAGGGPVGGGGVDGGGTNGEVSGYRLMVAVSQLAGVWLGCCPAIKRHGR